MTLQNRSGEAVILVVMGIMMGGMLLWMFSGHSHMSSTHGGRHSASEVRSGDRHDDVHDASERNPGNEGDDVPPRDRLRATDGDTRNP